MWMICWFTYTQDGGDALLAELMAICMGLELRHARGFMQIACESDVWKLLISSLL